MNISDITRNLKFRDLGYLVSLGQTRSIHRTASLHGISQPALSKILTEVEHTFGAQLFTRSRRGVSPTQLGALVVADSAQLIASLEALAARIEAESIGKNRIYRVGATPNPAVRLIPAAYKIVRQKLSNFTLELVEDTTESLLTGLKRGAYSLVVGRSSPQDDFSVIRQVPLYPESGVIVSRPGHPALKERVTDLATLLKYPWVLPQHGPTRTAIELSFMRARCNPPQPAFINYSIHIICNLLSDTDALSVLPLGPASSFISSGAIAQIPVDAEFHLPSYAIYRARHGDQDPALDQLEKAILRISNSLTESVHAQASAES